MARSRRSEARWELRAHVLAAALLALVACRGAPAPRYDARPGPYDLISERGLDELRAVRADLARGALDDAHERLERLRVAFPNNLSVGSLLQDVELERAWRARLVDPPAAGAEARARARAEAAAEQRERWRRLAEQEPSPVALVLAARLENDAPAALHLLDRALELDPECSWAHYGRAHVLARGGDWGAARESLQRALALDPGHLPSRRLEAAVLLRMADRRTAIAALRAWLDHAVDDPRVEPERLAAARIDLALLLLQDDRPDDAREILREGAWPSSEPLRRWAALAAAEQARGEALDALRAAEEAERAAPGDTLPLVQQALLYELWFDDLRSARALWQRVLEESQAGAAEGADLGTLMLGLRARVALERLDERLEPQDRARP